MVEKIILVTGMSGAGKSTAMSILEDLGYHCIDQFPTELMSELMDLLKTSSEPIYQHVALSISILEFEKVHAHLEKSGIDYQVLMLSAGIEQLVLRYKFTRHNHPLILEGKATGLESAINKEKEIYDAIPQYPNTTYLDTGDLDYQMLKKQIEEEFSLTVQHDLSITFESFGYKTGLPQDADFLFDVRIMPNPYWVPELRDYSGDNEDVYRCVMDSEISTEYLKRLTNFLDFIFDSYEKNGRAHIIIGIGCTGGKHRSVAVVNYLMDYYGEKYRCYKDSHSTKYGG